MSAPKVLISILNWNGATKTLACLASLQDEVGNAGADVTTLVIDNGSRDADYAALAQGVDTAKVQLQRIPTNLGFTGGHNVAIERAIREGYDYIWLLNNDAKVEPGVLGQLVRAMQDDERCGAASPLLRDIDDGSIARCVNTHNWGKRTTQRVLSIDEARRCQQERPEAVWVDGTAILFRVKALADVGALDDRLFAYYDDNDIGVRLANKGWYSRCIFDATVLHENKKRLEEFPLYLSYLLARNEMLFWHKNTPQPYRRLLRLKMLDRALFDAGRLYKNGWNGHGDAALRGVHDFLRGRFGPSNHEGKVPLYLRAACKMSALLYAWK